MCSDENKTSGLIRACKPGQWGSLAIVIAFFVARGRAEGGFHEGLAVFGIADLRGEQVGLLWFSFVDEAEDGDAGGLVEVGSFGEFLDPLDAGGEVFC